MHCAAYNDRGSGDVMKFLLDKVLDVDEILNSAGGVSHVCVLISTSTIYMYLHIIMYVFGPETGPETQNYLSCKYHGH